MCSGKFFDRTTPFRGCFSSDISFAGLARLIMAGAFAMSLASSQAAANGSALEIGTKLPNMPRAGR